MNSEGNLIVITVSREITSLYKRFLEKMEFLLQEGKITPQQYESLRKFTLDEGNEVSRKLVQFLDCFDFTLNEERTAKLAEPKRVVRKIVIGSSSEIV